MAERRYLTILFADLVGYTALSESLDPEDLRDLQLRYQQLALAVIEGQGGFVASFHGDGILAYFGYPAASESDPARAVQAALTLLAQLPRVTEETPGLPELSARIGLHTGLAVIGPERSSALNHEHNLVGEVATIAARLQAEAPANGVVVSETTHARIEDLFETAPLGARTLRGISRPIEVHQVLRPRRLPARGLVSAHRGAAQVVGRGAELARLRAEWQAVLEQGRGRLVEVVGEPGVGKTRLVGAFCQGPETGRAQVLQAAHFELLAETPLSAAGAMLRHRLRLDGDEPAAAVLARLRGYLAAFDLDSLEHAGLLAPLLGRPDVAPLPPDTPHSLRRRQFALMTAILVHAAARQPVLLWLEDAHWMDPSTVELLQGVLAATAELPMLVLMTRRSFPRPAGLPRAAATIALKPLSRQHCIALAATLPGGRDLPPALVARAAEIAEGVPLFMEQLTLALLRRGESSIEALPLTLAETLAARLDLLPGARRVVQAAACIGFRFAAAVLTRLLEHPKDAVAAMLEALVEAEILRRCDAGTYEFRHALLQRVAAESMMRADRRATHAGLAELLRHRPGVPPETIAHHLTQGERPAEATAAWLQAGTAAAQRSALREAIAHLRQGLATMARVADPAQRLELELKLQGSLVAPLTATMGSTHPDLAACCRRGLELCRLAPASPAIFPFVFGLFTHMHCRGRFAEALQLAELFLQTAQKLPDRSAEVMGHRMVGLALSSLGEVRRAIGCIETSLGLYQADRDAAAAHVFSQDAQVHGTALLSMLQLASGELVQAVRLATQAVDTAIALQHPHSLAVALSYVNHCFGLLGAGEALAWGAQRMMEVSEAHGLTIFRAPAASLGAWGRRLNGDGAAARAALAAAAEELEAAQFNVSSGFFLALAAEAEAEAGNRDRAADYCDRALAVVAQNGGRYSLDPEVRRMVAGLQARLHPAPAATQATLLRAAIADATAAGMRFYAFRSLQALAALGLADAAAEAQLASLADMPAEEQAARAVIEAWLAGQRRRNAPLLTAGDPIAAE